MTYYLSYYYMCTQCMYRHTFAAEYVLYNGAYSTCSGLTHLNLFCEDIFESVNVDQSELRTFSWTGRQGGWQKERQKKESDHHTCTYLPLHHLILAPYYHTHTRAPLFFANLSLLPFLPFPNLPLPHMHPSHTPW